MTVQKDTTIFAVAALMFLGSSAGRATIIANGSFGFGSSGGNISYSPGSPSSIIDATSVSIPTPTSTGACATNPVCEQITSIAPTYLGLQNDFAVGGNTPLNDGDDISFDSYTFDLTFAAFPTFTFTFEVAPSNRFKFVASSGTKATAVLGNSAFLNVSYNGTFSDSGGTYTSSPGSLSLSFTQTGGGTGTTTYSGTFATPPEPTDPTPEPVTLALFGSALLGLGIFGRKRFVR